MSLKMAVAAGAMAVAASPAFAEVTDAGAAGFALRHTVEIAQGDAADAFAAFTEIGAWWDPAHTYTGDAGRLSLDLSPGGCWCEQLFEGGFVEHMRLVYAVPGGLLRFSGGLGPLQAMGAGGAMTIAFDAREGGGARVTLTYIVSGYAPGGLQGMAGPVDAVLGQAMARLAAYAQARPEDLGD